MNTHLRKAKRREILHILLKHGRELIIPKCTWNMVQVSNKWMKNELAQVKKVYMNQEWVGQKYARD